MGVTVPLPVWVRCLRVRVRVDKKTPGGHPCHTLQMTPMATEDKADTLSFDSERLALYNSQQTLPTTRTEMHHVLPGMIRMPEQDKGKKRAMSLSSLHDSSKPPANKQHARVPSVASPSNEMPVISRPAITSIKSEECQVAFMEVDPEDSIPAKRSQHKRRVESSLRRVVTLEDSWRVRGIELPNASSVQVRSQSETRLRRASSKRSMRRPKQSVSGGET